jgi:hypothetical protein
MAYLSRAQMVIVKLIDEFYIILDVVINKFQIPLLPYPFSIGSIPKKLLS